LQLAVGPEMEKACSTSLVWFLGIRRRCGCCWWRNADSGMHLWWVKSAV